MKDYDVVIIGGGIGSLACAGILASEGVKVLVLEKNPAAGGYLTSFKRKGFTFDSAVDCFSGGGKDGAVTYLLKKLGVEEEVNLIKIDPVRESIFPGMRVKTWSSINASIEELKRLFPQEKGIDGFFEKAADIYRGITGWANEMMQSRGDKPALPSVFLKYGGITYKNLMDDYLCDERLKSVLSDRCQFLGLPPSRTSAINMSSLLMSYFISGAYRPAGGCQKLADALVKGIKQKGGHIIFNKEASKIITDNNTAAAVADADGTEYTADFIVSNIDYLRTCSILDSGGHASSCRERVEDYGVSPSFFILYIGAAMDLSFLGSSSSICYFPSFDMEKVFDFRNSFTEETPVGVAIPTMHDHSMAPTNCHALMIPELTEYSYAGSWKTEKQRLSDMVLKKAEKIIPGLSKHVVCREAATPATLERYTANFRGAAYGWKPMPWLRPIKTGVKNLYLAGHWDGLGGGVITATYSGFKTASEILRQTAAKKNS